MHLRAVEPAGASFYNKESKRQQDLNLKVLSAETVLMTAIAEKSFRKDSWPETREEEFIQTG